MDKRKYLSYSAYQKYCQCPDKYNRHYNEKIRPDFTTSSLVFGSVTDKAMNLFLLDTGDKANAIAEGQIEMVRLFKENVVLDGDEYDDDLITSETQTLLLEKLQECGWKGDNPKSLAEALFCKPELTENQKKALAYLVYFSWTEKLKLMLEAFEDYILPKIDKIISIQTPVKRGIFDFKATFKGLPGEYICDIKTSKYPYGPDDASLSVQMAGYGAEKAAYIVYPKVLKKNRIKICKKCGHDGTGKKHTTCDAEVDGVRCRGEWDETVTPEVVPQFIIGDISPEIRASVENAYSQTEQLIESGIFPRNLTSCGKQFGKPCEYINLCWKNDMKGLVKKDETK